MVTSIISFATKHSQALLIGLLVLICSFFVWRYTSVINQNDALKNENATLIVQIETLKDNINNQIDRFEASQKQTEKLIESYNSALRSIRSLPSSSTVSHADDRTLEEIEKNLNEQVKEYNSRLECVSKGIGQC